MFFIKKPNEFDLKELFPTVWDKPANFTPPALYPTDPSPSQQQQRSSFPFNPFSRRQTTSTNSSASATTEVPKSVSEDPFLPSQEELFAVASLRAPNELLAKASTAITYFITTRTELLSNLILALLNYSNDSTASESEDTLANWGSRSSTTTNGIASAVSPVFQFELNRKSTDRKLWWKTSPSPTQPLITVDLPNALETKNSQGHETAVPYFIIRQWLRNLLTKNSGLTRNVRTTTSHTCWKHASLNLFQGTETFIHVFNSLFPFASFISLPTFAFFASLVLIFLPLCLVLGLASWPYARFDLIECVSKSSPIVWYGQSH